MDTSKKKISTNQKKKKKKKRAQKQNTKIGARKKKKKTKPMCAHGQQAQGEKTRVLPSLSPLPLPLPLPIKRHPKKFPSSFTLLFFPHPPKNSLYQTHPQEIELYKKLGSLLSNSMCSVPQWRLLTWHFLFKKKMPTQNWILV